ncbi:VOC family protein [Endozoicomonas sp. G2_1]|uniref:VOC family protein n=1 Tax=Endozoicomonas sp. G2_1 TaxID=2821091 RepID=UPI001ADA04D7|nr:VOC family protein [Endozoicomonas sp. G2_1]MBO9491964.1 VOC family protein [Endozoicomonas sp. G2_1]
MSVKPIPKGFRSVNPYLVVRNANQAIEFYQNAFNAKVTLELNTPTGTVAHAELKIGNTIVMLTEEYPEMGFFSPDTLGGSAVSLMLYLKDVDQAVAQAIEAGAIETRPVADQFYGDRTGTVKDPFGHTWTIATHIEDLTDQELKDRMAAFFENAGA